MDRWWKTMIVVLVLCVITEMKAEAYTLDVCATCHPNATCDQKADDSGKVCNCKYGFVGNGRTYCQDKDECQIGASKICGQHTTCHNTYGSYYCTCLHGYTPTNNMDVFIPNDGTNCQDIDECRIPGLCGEGGQCRNTDGSFECSCQLGYRVHDGAEPFHPGTDKSSCKLVDCGQPAAVADTVLLSVTGTTYNSVATFACDVGFVWRSGDNSSVCEADGLWRGHTSVCEDVSCGPPLNLPHTNLLWDGTTAPGSVVQYECVAGFDQDSGNDVSTCLQSGEWGNVSVKCKAKCGPIPFLDNSEVVWYNRSVVIHRCVRGYQSWRGSNMSVCGSSGLWQRATLRCIEIKPPVNHLLIVNEKCLRWKAEKYEEVTEVYKVTYVGSRDYQRSFRDKMTRRLISRSDEVELCLNLLPLTNYSISVTAVSVSFTATITVNTSLTAPPAPVVYFREFEIPAPTLKLRRSPNTLDPISLFQVFVLPVEGIMTFDCSDPSNSTKQYITAQIELRYVGTEMNFTVGDGLYYGGCFNEPLQNGRDYYIILRSVSQWKTAFKSSCVLWAIVRGTSYVLRVSSLSAAASIVVVALVTLGGYSLVWFLKKT